MQLKSNNWNQTWDNGLVPNWERSKSRLYIVTLLIFNLYAEYNRRNTGLEEAQAGIKIAGRNFYNLRYAYDTTLMAESEELKSLLMKVKEESGNIVLKLNIQKTKISIWSHHFMANRLGKNGNSERLYFWGFQNHCRW